MIYWNGNQYKIRWRFWRFVGVEFVPPASSPPLASYTVTRINA